MYMNKVILAGFTGRDAKTGATQAGKQIARLSVATTKRYKERQQEKYAGEDTVAHLCCVRATG